MTEETHYKATSFPSVTLEVSVGGDTQSTPAVSQGGKWLPASAGHTSTEVQDASLLLTASLRLTSCSPQMCHALMTPTWREVFLGKSQAHCLKCFHSGKASYTKPIYVTRQSRSNSRARTGIPNSLFFDLKTLTPDDWGWEPGESRGCGRQKLF